MDDRIAAERAAALKAAMVAGLSPSFADVPALTQNSAERSEALNRLNAATQATAELAADASAAERNAKAAKDELAAAVLAVVAAEADAIAEKILELEAAAFALRQRIGCEFGYLDQAKAPLSLRTIALLRSNGSTTIMARNTPEWRASEAANAAWMSFTALLANDPNAELSFQTSK